MSAAASGRRQGRVPSSVVTGQDIEVRVPRRRARARAAGTARAAKAAKAANAVKAANAAKTARALAAAATALAVLAGCAGGSVLGAGTGQAATARAATSPVSATRGASPGPSGSPAGPPARQSAPASPPSSPPASPSVLPVGPPAAASLPQTSALPRTDDTAFGNAVHDIWLAVTTGDPNDALPAFFPEQAYQQVKAIADPDADWDDRLWHDFTLDVAAAHRLVPRGATLVKVIVPAQYAQWIGVGACYNKVGYWHVPGARVVYRTGGVTRSFGIASFISWRGVWYLVHFGAVVRGGDYGIVDDPAAGEGVTGPPGGC